MLVAQPTENNEHNQDEQVDSANEKVGVPNHMKIHSSKLKNHIYNGPNVQPLETRCD